MNVCVSWMLAETYIKRKGKRREREYEKGRDERSRQGWDFLAVWSGVEGRQGGKDRQGGSREDRERESEIEKREKRRER